MTKRNQRHLAILLKRRNVLMRRAETIPATASFLPEIIQELHAMEWAIAVIYAAHEYRDAKADAEL